MEMNTPKGYVAVPLFDEEPRPVVWVGVLVALQPTPETGALVLLRDMMDARVYLGCVMDAGGRVQQWVEIWVQAVAGLKRSPAAASGALTNSLLDERWRSVAATLRSLDGDEGVWSGYEVSHPAPVFLKLQPPAPVFPRTKDGVRWRLCEDDALLERNGLPPYRSSLDRYLVADGGEAGVRFVPVTPDAPATATVVPYEEWLSSDAERVPLNPEGGLLLIRPYCALGFGEYLDVLAGNGWAGMACGRTTLDPCGLAKVIGSAEEPNRLFLEASDATRQVVEMFYLKMGLLADALKATEAFIRDTRRPLLNLDENAFRVSLCQRGSAMPCLWTACVSLVGSGDAVELPLATTEVRYFVRGSGQDLSIYRPQSAGMVSSGRCGIRIRQTLPETRRGLALEGTFQTRDPLVVSPCDLVWLRLPLPTGVVDLYATLEESGTQTRGEWRFRTVEQRFDPMRAGALKALAGIPMQNIAYEVIPQQSTPCDLYALAVLAVRLLLVNDRNTLPVALDGVLSLAREAEFANATDETLAAVIAAAFARDPQWGQLLGPQFLSGKELKAEQAFQGLPPALWYDTLALVVRMFPGPGSFRTCHHLGDAQDSALESVLRRCRADVASVSCRARGFIAGDEARNQEIRDIVRACRQKIG